MSLQRTFHTVYPVFVLPFSILCFFVLMELDLATGIPQDTASVLYALLPHTNTQTLCLFLVLSSLLFFWHRVFLLFSLFSHVRSCWSYSATGHRPWSFALDEDKKDEEKKTTDLYILRFIL